MKRLVFVWPLLLVLLACPAVENNARDASAALGGAIKSAQAQHQDECKLNGTLSACTLINRAVDGQNALITATEAYCGWSTAAPPPDPTTKCVAVTSLKAGLQTAINNANAFVLQLKGVIK
jgi:hypothetical protein